MTDTAPHVIVLQTRSYMEHEGMLADDTKPITPGMLVEIDSGGTRPSLIPQTASGAFPTQLLVAVEFQQIGKGIDDVYTVEGETIDYYEPIRGEHMYLLLEAGTAAITTGDILESVGDGYVGPVTDSGIVRALEDVDNSIGAEDVHIRVEVL